MHLEDKSASVQLRLLRNLPSKALQKKKNKISGFYRKKSYVWIAFDNRSGNMWVGEWLHKGDCLQWLNHDPG